MSTVEALTILALLGGPLAAVLLTREADRWRDARQRRLDVFRVLMRTRASRVAVDHVGALNLIPLEFFGHDKIIDKYKQYIANLNLPNPTRAEDYERFTKARNDLFLELMFEIGSGLRYKFDRHELDGLSYTPQLFVDDENRNRLGQARLTEILDGKRAFPVRFVLGPDETSPFPQPPTLPPTGKV